MIFEPRKFFMHDKGRCIAILGTVKSFKFGELLVIEETDATGHAMSCVERKDMDTTNWTEIGKAEFMKVFNGVKDVLAN